MEKYLIQIFEFKYLLPDIEYTKEYYLIKKKINLFVFTDLTSCIKDIIFLINIKYYLTLVYSLFNII